MHERIGLEVKDGFQWGLNISARSYLSPLAPGSDQGDQGVGGGGEQSSHLDSGERPLPTMAT